MKRKLFKDIRLKNGLTLVKGTVVDISMIKGSNSVCKVTTNNQEYTLRITSVLKAPSIKTIESWICDSPCYSIAGCNCDPDGYDEKGYPSWLLVLGLV